MVKDFWRKAASPCCHPLRRRMDSSDLDPYMINSSWTHVSHLDWFSSFCAHHSEGCQCFSMGQTTPKTCPFLPGDLHPHVTHGSLGPHSSVLQTASWSVQPFFRRAHECVQQTDHATLSIAIDRYHLLSLQCGLKTRTNTNLSQVITLCTHETHHRQTQRSQEHARHDTHHATPVTSNINSSQQTKSWPTSDHWRYVCIRSNITVNIGIVIIIIIIIINVNN